MHLFPDYATARSVVCGSGRVARAAPTRQQNAVLHRARCKRDWSHLQEGICWAIWIAPSRAELAVFRAQANFALRFAGARADVPWSPPRKKSKPQQQRARSLTTTNCARLL